MKRTVLLILFSSLIITSSCTFIPFNLTTPPTEESDMIISVTDDDPEMNAAIQRTQETLPLFIEMLQAPEHAEAYFTIKVQFPVDIGDGGEHMWVDELVFEEDHFSGILVSNPEHIQDLEYGDLVQVELEDISDWLIIEEGHVYGGFTIYVLMDRMSESERKQFNEDFGYALGNEPVLP